MASKYSIEAVFKLIDRVSAPTSKVGRALDKLGIKSKTVSNALKNNFDKAAKHIDKLGASIKKWAGRAVLGGIAAIGIGIGVATKKFIEFDSQLYKAGAIFSDLDPRALDFQTRLEKIGKAARAVAAATEFDAEQTDRALKTMAMAGIKSTQAIELLPHVTDMATAASVDLDEAVGMAAGALNVFGKMTDDPVKLAKNFQYVSDVMVTGANLANMSLSDMSEAVSSGGARFKDVNQRIEDYIAAIDILADVNKRGAEAGNAISAIMTQLAAKPGDVSKALQELGIRTQDTQGNMLNFVDIIGQLNVAMKGMGTAKQDEYLFRIFGKNRMNYARPLIDAGVEGFRTYAQELDKAAGSTQRKAEAMRNSIKNKLAGLGSAATEMGFKFIDAFKDKAATAIGSATEAIRNFDVTPLVSFASTAADGIMKFAGVLTGAVKTAWQFRYMIAAILIPITAVNLAFMIGVGVIDFYNKIILIKNGVVAIATGLHMAYASVVHGNTAATAALAFTTNSTRMAFVIFSGVLKAVTFIQTKLITLTIAARNGTLMQLAAEKLFTAAMVIRNGVLNFLTGGTLASTAATAAMAVANGTATASQWALNAAMTANPIGIVIVAVGALIALIVLLVKNWDRVSAAIKNNQNKVMALIAIFTGPFGIIISVIKEVIQNFGLVTKAFTDGGIIAGIKKIGGVLLSGLLVPVQGLLEIL